MQVWPQTEATSFTHEASHLDLQQKASCAHTWVAHASHVAVSFAPAVQTSWEHVSPGAPLLLVLPELEPPELEVLPLLLPPELELPLAPELLLLLLLPVSVRPAVAVHFFSLFDHSSCTVKPAT